MYGISLGDRVIALCLRYYALPSLQVNQVLAPLRAAALEDANILLSCEGAGVVAIDHVDTGTGIAGKGEHVDAVAIK